MRMQVLAQNCVKSFLLFETSLDQTRQNPDEWSDNSIVSIPSQGKRGITISQLHGYLKSDWGKDTTKTASKSRHIQRLSTDYMTE